MSDTWWPPGYDLPAFRVRRESVSSVTGGDYVRGSARIQGSVSGTLPVFPVTDKTDHTDEAWVLAAPLPTAPAWQPLWTKTDLAGNPIIPAPVPAAVGHVVRWNGTAWINIGPLSDTPHTAVRYPTTAAEDEAAVGKALLFCYPGPWTYPGVDYHTVEIIWGWPTHIAATWEEVALVRSSFGNPSTPRDGMTVIRELRSKFDDGTTVKPPPIVLDRGLPSGRWYYYTLFFRVKDDWKATMSDGCVLPRDWKHSEHMWDCVPPYYQWVDDNYRVGKGFLRQLLSVFGFAMDNTREYVEGLLDLHHIDYTPMQLLKGLGANYGLPYESRDGVGDIRYRGLIANVPSMQHSRGTALGLKSVIEAVSKYECDITGSTTLMLYPDDSNFHRSTGNWGGLHPDAISFVVAAENTLYTIPWNDIYVARVNEAPAPNTGVGVMRVYTAKADETKSLMFVCGDSRIRDDPDDVLAPADDSIPFGDVVTYRDALPVAAGIPITAGRPYGFSVWVKATEKDFNVQAFMIWIGPTGTAYEVLEVAITGPVGTAGTAWKQYIAQGVAPVATATLPEARYLIPGVFITGRVAGTMVNRSAPIDVCSAMVYPLGDENTTVSISAPDRYLRMGDDTEKMGPPKSGFEGFIIGSPKRSS